MPRITTGLKWTPESAQSEFGTDAATIAKRLKAANIVPTDGTFSTKQICAAIFGDIHAARLRLVNEQADAQAMENARTRGDLISADGAFLAFSNVAFAIKRVIETSGLSTEDRDTIMNEIKSFDMKQLSDALKFQQDPTAK